MVKLHDELATRVESWASAATTRYEGDFDPLVTYARLRDAEILGDYSYVHVRPDEVEIGWMPLERVQFLDGASSVDWRKGLIDVANRAAASGRKAFGYIGFDAADSRIGTLPDRSVSGCPLVEFIIPGEVLRFTAGRVVHHSAARMDVSRNLAVRTAPHEQRLAAAQEAVSPTYAVPDQAFATMVAQATGHLRRRDVEKVVLSRFEAFDIDYDGLAVLAAFCASPRVIDAFLISFGPTTVILSSPELLLQSRSREIETNPLAGTRPRGATTDEDEALRRELKVDHKEVVEHVISVTTMLAELEAVCEPGSLVVRRLMDVMLQQRVQHLSSVICGRLARDRHVIDAFAALFPSITVSGHSKAQAIALIRALEDGPRWLYAGACGWVSGAGDARLSLAIRGAFRHGRHTFVHAGAGIMAESSPEGELMETRHKLSATREALFSAAAARRADQG